jgi:hypothetical protein
LKYPLAVPKSAGTAARVALVCPEPSSLELGEVDLRPLFDILAESVEAILIFTGALKPGTGSVEDADPSTADEVESLRMGDFVEEAQDGAATGGQR